ncbi:MAG: hypothetical protein V4510_07125 [bacterium]
MKRVPDSVDVPWRELGALLSHPLVQGAGTIQVVSRQQFWDEDGLPFRFEGGGSICHIVPDRGFRKEALAGSEDERLLIVDCPDDEGWLVPEDVVADWMARNVTVPALDDVLLSHRLYEYLTHPDDEGLSRGGKGDLVQWAPGLPHLASIAAPEFLPNDPEAPRVNRDRRTYAAAVKDLLRQLERRFELEEIEVGVRFGKPPAAPEDDPEGAGAA